MSAKFILLTELEFPLTLIGIRWFLCLFSADLEPESACRLWDFAFSHGVHVIFGFALGLLACQEEELLATHDVHDLFMQLRAGRTNVAPALPEESAP